MAQIFETRMVRASLQVNSKKRSRHSVTATQAIANVVKSSFGPSGLDKMMVDDIGVLGHPKKRIMKTKRA